MSDEKQGDTKGENTGMGRIIDADEFSKFIKELPKNPNGYSKVYDEAAILRFIDAQPTVSKDRKGRTT